MKKQLLFFLLFIQFLQSQSQSLVANIVVTDESCDLGSISITASGGDGNYFYATVLEGTPVSESDFSPNEFFNVPAGNYDVYVRDNSGQTGFSEYTSTVTVSSAEEVDYTTIVTQPLCSGDLGEVNISVVDSYPPYTFEIFNATNTIFNSVLGITNDYVFTDLPEGDYTISVIDSNGCVNTKIATILGSPPLNANASLTSSYTCNTFGEITFAEASGGIPPYFYGVNGVFSTDLVQSNLTDGTYELSVRDANGCQQNLDAITIEPTSYLNLALTSTNSSCFGAENGEIQVAILEGATPYQINLYKSTTGIVTSVNEVATNYNFINLSSDEFYVEVIDANGCSSTSIPVTIEEPELLTFNAVANTNCYNESGGEIIVEGLGGTPPYEFSIDEGITWQSSNTFSGLSDGDYKIDIRDTNGCSPYSYSVEPFENGSFEDVASILDTGTFKIVDEDLVSGWETTALDNKLEIWQSGFLNVPAYEGSYFVELNANENSILYQEFSTNEGDIINWQVAHRGRSGTDVAQVKIGGTIATATAQQTMSTGNTDWILYSGLYTVPANQSSTSILFEAISTANGNLAVGNFLDAISIDVLSTTSVPFSIEVINPPSLVGTVNELEGTGTIEVVATGGIPPYEYSIDGGTTFQLENIFTDLPPYTYSCVVKDSNGCTENTVEIVIEGNTPIVLDDTFTVSVNTNTIINIYNNDEFIPAIGTINVTNPLNGIVFIENSGTVDAPSDAIVTYIPNDNFIGIDTFEYTICDNETPFNCSTATVTVEVTNTNNSPVAADDYYTTYQNTSIVLTPLDNDSDQDGDVVFIDSINGVSIINGEAILIPISQGVINVSSSGVIVFEPEDGFYGEIVFPYVISDGNGETDTADTIISVIQDVSIIINLSSSSISCFGGQDGAVEVATEGGIAPFRYQLTLNDGVTIVDIISNQASYTFTNLESRDYQVKVTDNDFNTASEWITVATPDALEMLYEYVNPTCNGDADGIVYLYPSGGTGIYSYSINSDPDNEQLSNTFTNLVTGTYFITVTDENGCTLTEVVTLTEPEPVVINSIVVLPSGNQASGNILAGATGGNGNYTFSIDEFNLVVSNQFFDLEAGIYQIIASDANGCSSVPFTVVIVKIDIDNSITQMPTGGLTANFQGAISYQWIDADTQKRIPGATDINYIPSKYGRYQVEMVVNATSVSGKGIETSYTTETVLSPVIDYTSGVLGIADVSLGSFSAYPNPATEFITVPTHVLNTNYSVHDLLGKQVDKGILIHERIDLVEYSKGVYFLKVEGYKVVKFIKK